MVNKIKYNTRGTTLAELMITVVILSVIMLGIQEFFGSGLRFFRSNQIKAEIQRNARTSISLMNRKLREAKSSTITIDRVNSSQPPCSRVTFSTIDSESLSFYQSGTKLYIADLLRGSTKEMAQDLRVLLFAYPMLYDDKILSISLCFEKGTGSLEQKALQMSVEKIRLMND
jgi:Tfp pilus assembly protein PilE